MTNRRWLVGAAVIAGILAGSAPASAKIVKTILGGRNRALTVGSGVEYESDDESTQYDLPLLVEYGLAPSLELTLEPNYTVTHSKTSVPSASGWGDFETTLTWEATQARRWRPGVSVESTIKWPVSNNPELGTGKRDYSLGLVLSRTHGTLSLDANAIYTWVGRPAGVGNLDTIEGSLAMEWAATRLFDLEAEFVSSNGAFRGRPGTISGLGGQDLLSSADVGRETEFTLGIAEHPVAHLKLEQGTVFVSDGSWQLVFAWEWDFEE